MDFAWNGETITKKFKYSKGTYADLSKTMKSNMYAYVNY